VREVMPIFSVYTLMMQAHGEGPVEISTLLIVWSVAAFVFEVPSGTIGDRFPRRSVLAISRFIQALAFVVWLVFPTFWGFAAGFVLWGLSGSLWSGTNEALLYESLAERGQAHRFDELYGRASAFATLGIAVALASGGWLATFGYTVPLVLSIALTIVVGVATLGLFGTPKPALREDADAEPRAPLAAAVQDFRTRPLIRHMALAIALALVFYGCFEEYIALLFTEAGLSLAHMGIWYAACYGVRAIAMALAPRFRFDPLVVLVLSGVLLLPGVMVDSAAWLVASCIVYFALNGVSEVRIVTVLQAEQSGSGRATVMSLARLGILASGPLVYIASGQLAEAHGWIAAAWLAALGTVSTSAALWASAPPPAAAATGAGVRQ
jgi:MFS family permease